MLLKQVFYLISLLVSFPHGAPGFGMRLMEISGSDHSQVVCTLALLQKYFQYGEPLSGSVISMSFTSASLHIQQDLLNAMHTQVVIPWTVVVRNPRQAPNNPRSTMILHEKPQCYFIIIENLEDGDLEDVFEDWKTNINWNPLAQFVVYLASVEETDDEMNELLIEILLSFMNKKIYNVNVIGRNEENGFYYGKTVFPYHPDNNCGNRVIAIETLDMCDYQDPNKPKDEYNFDEEGDGDEVDYDIADDDGGLENNNINKRNNDGEFDDEHGAKDGEGHQDDNRDADTDEDVVRDKDGGKNTYGNRNSDMEGDENTGQDADHRVVDGAKMDEYNDRENGGDLDGNEILEKENDSKRSVEGYIKLNRHQKLITESNERGELNWNFGDFRHERKSKFKITKETRTKKILYTREIPKKRSQPKYLKLTDYSQEDRNELQTPNIYLQELYRASFLDKFPKDLSGCPVVAAFRPWEPYIFKESSDYENKADSNPRANKNNEVLDTYDLGNEENVVNNSYIDDNDDAESENFYNDVDADDVSDEPAFKLNGIEYQLVQTIGERLHITIDFQLENTNLYHLFQQLIDGDIELILGGIDEDPSISQFVSSSIPYHQDDLTWCVARAKRKYDLFNFLQSFHMSTWFFTFAFIMISSLNIYIAQKLLKIRPTYFGDFFATVVRMFGIILSQSTQLTRLPASLHITFGSTFFLAIMFVNVYQSFLVSTLTTPKSSYQISHLDEIYRNRMTVTGSVENVRHLSKDGKIFKYIREKFQMCYNIEECLNRAATDESFAVAVSRQHSFYNPHIKRDQLYCFDRNENIYVYLVTMLLPKKFHLLPKINPVIQHIIESGHMQKWARELDLKRRIREEIQRAQKVLVKSLTINQIVGSFALHGMLSAVALIIFILEYWTHWMVVKRRTRLRLVKFLHRKFSSRSTGTPISRKPIYSH